MSEHGEQGTPSILIDRVEMTYSVRLRGRTRPQDTKRTWGGRLKDASGMHTAKVHALKETSLVIRHGESVGIIGSNGSGKSTLMKLLAGHLRPTKGQILAVSNPVLLGVNAALVRTMSGHDNITLGCLAMGMSLAEVEAKRPEIVRVSGLDEQALALPMKSYSSGMGARLQFAISTAVDPEILIIDEALNTGDAIFKARTRERIDELRANAGSVLLVSHNLKTIQELCTRTIWLEKGEVLGDGDPKTITRAYNRYTTLAGGPSQNRAHGIKVETKRSLVTPEIRWAD